MAFLKHHSPQLSHLLKCFLSFLILKTSLYAERVPAYVFPDIKSDVITWIEVTPGQTRLNPVLDSALEGSWYWSTHEDDYVGYVSTREILNRNMLKPGTMIRTNPTYHSWILTKYQRGDRVGIRSRLSVGRVSFHKKIPVYFQLPEPPPTEAVSAVEITPVQETEISEEPLVARTETTLSSEIASPSDAVNNEPAESEKIESTPEPELNTVLPAPVTIVPELAESTILEPVDPYLEEKPRIATQELANMAPPPADLYQEFEGFFKIVPATDPKSKQFQYQLETRSGQRIVYIDVSQLRIESYESDVDQWINIRGSLDETGSDFSLFIKAKGIWIAPKE